MQANLVGFICNIGGDHGGQRLHFVDFLFEVLQSCSANFAQFSPSKTGPKWNIRCEVYKTVPDHHGHAVNKLKWLGLLGNWLQSSPVKSNTFWYYRLVLCWSNFWESMIASKKHQILIWWRFVMLRHPILLRALSQSLLKFYPIGCLSHLLVHMGWVDFDLGCSTICPILFGQMRIWQNWLCR